jgi:predicted polyphosphate/ATP-dependent NAD kinase
VLGGAKDKLRRAWDGWQAVADDLLVGVHLPGQKFIASGDAEGAPVRAVEALDNGTVIESQIIPVIFFFGEGPALSSRHLLEELHDERFAVNEDPVEIEDDGA